MRVAKRGGMGVRKATLEIDAQFESLRISLEVLTEEPLAKLSGVRAQFSIPR